MALTGIARNTNLIFTIAKEGRLPVMALVICNPSLFRQFTFLMLGNTSCIFLTFDSFTAGLPITSPGISDYTWSHRWNSMKIVE